MTRMPGIYLCSCSTNDDSVRLKMIDLFELKSTQAMRDMQVGDWLNGCLLSRKPHSAGVYSDDLFDVYFDGYLTEISNDSNGLDLNQPAEVIAKLFRRLGEAAFCILHGSYVFTIINHSNGEVKYVNDRLGSRSVYYFQNEEYFVLGPDPEALLPIVGQRNKLSLLGASQFIMSGRLYDDQTLLDGVKSLKSACIITLRKNSSEIKRYWKLKFESSEDISTEKYEDLIAEYGALLHQATSRVLKIDNPFLFMSGGIDSRLVLSGFRSNNRQLPLVSYGLETIEGGDWQAAFALATDLGMQLIRYPINIKDFINDAEDCVRWTGSTVQVIDAPSLLQMWKDLGSNYNAFVNGDECFGWKKYVTNSDQALNNNMLIRPKQSSRYMYWVNAEIRHSINKLLNEALDKIITQATEKDPNNLKDSLHFEECIRNEVNCFTSPKLKLFEQVRPLLDVDLIEFIARLPIRVRCGKQFLRDYLQQKDPELIKVPFAKRSSLPGPMEYTKFFSETPKAAEYVYSQLFDNMNPELAKLLNLDLFKSDVSNLINKRPLNPLPRSWLGRLPGMWRVPIFEPASREHPMILMLRVLQLNIYINQIT